MPIHPLACRLSAGLALLLAGSAWAGTLTVEGAYVREMPPVARNTAAFMQVSNPGDASLTIVGARTPVARRAELHDHLRDGDVMRMRPVDAVEIPARSAVRFQPGGLHVMLMELVAPLAAGQTVELVLELSDGSHVPVRAPVRALSAAPVPDHGSMAHESAKP